MAGFFGFFDYTKPGKGISEEDLDKSGLALYFDILARRFWKIITLNILFLITSIPAIAINWAVSAFLITMLNGYAGGALEQDALMVLQMFTTVTLLLFTGSGSASAAMAYVLRKYVKDTHSWVWSDFFENLKSNFLQGTIVYIINLVVISLMALALMFYWSVIDGAMSMFLTTIVAVVGFIFLMMQMYVYHMMAGFKLKIKDIYRNSLLLTLGKLPWNVLSFGVTLVFVYLYSLTVNAAYSVFIIVFILYSIIAFTQIFMTNNIVYKYVEEPSETAQKEE